MRNWFKKKTHPVIIKKLLGGRIEKIVPPKAGKKYSTYQHPKKNYDIYDFSPPKSFRAAKIEFFSGLALGGANLSEKERDEIYNQVKWKLRFDYLFKRKCAWDYKNFGHTIGENIKKEGAEKRKPPRIVNNWK